MFGSTETGEVDVLVEAELLWYGRSNVDDVAAERRDRDVEDGPPRRSFQGDATEREANPAVKTLGEILEARARTGARQRVEADVRQRRTVRRWTVRLRLPGKWAAACCR